MPEKEWKYASVDLSSGTQTIESVPCLVKGAIVTTGLNAYACEIDDSSATVWALPANAQVGDSINEEGGVRFETNLTVTPNASGTGRITLTYRRLREA